MTAHQSHLISKLAVPGPHARKIKYRDEQVISPSLPRSYPLVIDHAKGAQVWDVDGNRFIDFMTGIAVASTGHCHPDVVAAIKAQADRFLHICLSDFYYDVAVELAEKLASLAPFNDEALVFFTNSGAEAIEAAMKLARYYQKRHQFIAFYGGFHGRTLGALSLTASKIKQKQGFAPFMSGVTHIPYPDPNHPVLRQSPAHHTYGETVIAYLEDVVFTSKIDPSDVAAIIIEPILGEGGYVVPAEGFFPALRELCDRHGILLIADEVQSGIGRTGKWWAIEHFGIEPDIVTSAKGLASGMPLGAMIARKQLMTWLPGAHGSTFGGNPVSCAAALATLRVIEDEFLQNAARQGDHLMRELQELATQHTLITNVRGKGLMIGLDIVPPEQAAISAGMLRDQVIDHAFEYGLLLLGAGTQSVRLMPPLMINRETVDEALAVFDHALTAVEQAL